ncbi:hypothetical protein [Streptomyces sp. NPDC002215]|uniref:hypothetical protein n=1 Tax=Streptomyces sp. NPDC002215 TaxID=3154412 RepID=UPI00332B6E71
MPGRHDGGVGADDESGAGRTGEAKNLTGPGGEGGVVGTDDTSGVAAVPRVHR